MTTSFAYPDVPPERGRGARGDGGSRPLAPQPLCALPLWLACYGRA